MDNSIKVIIRFKTFINEKEEQSSNWQIGEEEVTYSNNKQDDIYNFDTILPPTTQQEDVFNSIMLPKIGFFMQGYNSAVFAYGATSSGKTFTILGPDSTINQLVDSQGVYALDCNSGILPRSFFEIIDGYKQIKQTENVKDATLKVSYVEIYNEAVYDLLNQQFRAKDQRVDLKIGNITNGPKLLGVREVKVTDVSSLFEQIALGTKNRSVGATQFNSRSSRSHVIFNLELIVEWNDKSIRTSKIQFIDLAGSERLAKQVANGQLLQETKKINQSLTCLGHCIMALSSRKHKHVPYRDSKLTLLLKECLGGNSNTSFICAVSAAQEHDEKTLQTLKFAQRAKRIVNKVKLNIKLSYDQIERQMNLLKQEMSQMEKLLMMHGIQYDKNLFKDEMEKYQIQNTENLNIDVLTKEYRKSLRKSVTRQNQQDVKSEFRQKFQMYMEQNSNQLSMSGSTRQLRSTSSLPCSLEGSDVERERSDSNSSDQHQLIDAIEAIMSTPKVQQEFITGRSTQTGVNISQKDKNDQNNKKRESCCQLM